MEEGETLLAVLDFFFLGGVLCSFSVGSVERWNGGPRNFSDNLLPAMLWVSKVWYRS